MEEEIKTINNWWANFDLKAVMLSKKMTQKELAEETGVPQSCISSYVNRYGNTWQPSQKNKAKLYNYFEAKENR